MGHISAMVTIGLSLNPRQQQVFDLLNNRNDVLANRYLAILIALDIENNPESLAQAAHSARYLLRHLYKINESIPEYQGQDTAFTEIEEFVIKCCEKTTVQDLAESTQKMNEYYNKARTSQKDRLIKLIQSEDSADIKYPECWNQPVLIYGEAINFFDRVAHFENIADCESNFLNHLGRIEDIIIGLLDQNIKLMNKIDNLISVPYPDEEALNKLPHLLIKANRLEYFFRNLEQCAWIEPLKEAGYFQTPILAIKYEDGSISSSVWPQCEFLEKCINSTPDEIAQCIFETKPTDSWNTINRLMEVLLKLPIDLIPRFIGEKTKSWINNSTHGVAIGRFAELVIKLKDNGRPKEMFVLFEQIIGICTSVLIEEPQHTTLEYQYLRILKQLLPKLTQFNAFRTTQILCRQLDKAIKSIKPIDRDDPRNDGLYYSRKYIFDNEENTYGDNIINCLIDAIRDAIILYENNQYRGKAPIEVLNKFTNGFYIFTRIKLYILSEFPSKYIDQIAKILISTEYLYSDMIDTEIDSLISASFDEIPEESKNKFIELINNRS